MNNDTARAQYSYDDVESLIQTKLRRALETNDSWIAKRATRNVLKFILDLARLAETSVIEGTVFTPIMLATTKELKPEYQGTQPKHVQEVVDLALEFYSQVYEKEKADELIEKLRHEEYPA
ncbi:MAG: hypothetical protein OXG65_10995 [Chloroflexi bacterium]|nr:hypothetical protein [Chloroflexota bacterium]